MKKVLFVLVTVVLVCAGLSGCATRRPFDEYLFLVIASNERAKTGNSNLEEITVARKFQYFISEGVHLSREYDLHEMQIAGTGLTARGTAVIQLSSRMDEKFVLKRTPCIVVDMVETTNEYGEIHRELHVAFEPAVGGQFPILKFRTLNPQPGPNDKYFLVYDHDTDKIDYNGFSYDIRLMNGTAINQDNVPFLNIKVKVREDRRKQKQTLRGLRVTNTN